MTLLRFNDSHRIFHYIGVLKIHAKFNAPKLFGPGLHKYVSGYVCLLAVYRSLRNKHFGSKQFFTLIDYNVHKKFKKLNEI